MARLSGGRPGFREWVDKQTSPDWKALPLTHICKGISALDIISTMSINTAQDSVFDEPTAYLFYGRPAYRVNGDGALKFEAACPFCFVFDPSVIEQAAAIFAFDTGAFSNRLYNRLLMEEMSIEDFLLDMDVSRPHKLISAVFGSLELYFDGDTRRVTPPEQGADSWEYHARAYLHLLTSPGRNEPDDRVCSIEVIFDKAVQLKDNLKAVVVPHTHWEEQRKAPWVETLASSGVTILPYMFVPGRHPEHYHTLVEMAVREYYKEAGFLEI